MSTSHATLINRAGAVSLLIIAIAGIYMLTIYPYMNLITGYKTEMASLSERIGRFNTLIGQKEKFQHQLLAIKNNNVSNQYFIKAGTVTLASAGLQQKIKQIVQAKGAQLVSTQVSLPANFLADGKGGDVKDGHPVSVKVTMKSSVDSTYEVFYAMESSTNPLVTIDDLSIGKINQGRRLNVSSGKEPELLDVRFTVTAYMKNNG